MASKFCQVTVLLLVLGLWYAEAVSPIPPSVRLRQMVLTKSKFLDQEVAKKDTSHQTGDGNAQAKLSNLILTLTRSNRNRGRYEGSARWHALTDSWG